MTLWQQIAQHISRASGKAFNPAEPHSLGGGCINQAVRLTDGESSWFVKVNLANRLSMFEAEAEGLNALADTNTVRVPRALCTGSTSDSSYIVMRYLALTAAPDNGQALAAEQLARLHRGTAERFGWHRDNTIGATHQANDRHHSWIDFWREQRLGLQLQEAAGNGYGGKLQRSGEQLLWRFDVLIDHNPQPSLLHGDLWGGNIGFDQDGQPVIFDPATYYGDREADIAMTELFGGFTSEFYQSYQRHWPLHDGYPLRKTLYNLYHILNHLNMFGSGYAGQAQSMIDRLLAHC